MDFWRRPHCVTPSHDIVQATAADPTTAAVAWLFGWQPQAAQKEQDLVSSARVRVCSSALPRGGVVQPLATIVRAAVEWHPAALSNRLPGRLARWDLLLHLEEARTFHLVHHALEASTIARPIGAVSTTRPTIRRGLERCDSITIY